MMQSVIGVPTAIVDIIRGMIIIFAVAGRGFIALATVIFGRWSAVGVMLASLLFGFFDGLNVALQASFQSAPVMFFKMIPYIFTIVALMFFGSKHGGPKANGKPYFRESR